MKSKPWMGLVLFLVLAVGAASAQNPTLFATGVTSPGGGMVLTGTAINPNTGQPYRHLWTSDQGGFGLCRMDPDIDTPGPHFLNGGTCMSFVAGVQFKPGQFAFDPLLNNIYAVDLQANTRGIFRLHYVPTGSNGHGSLDLINTEVLGGNNLGHNTLPGCGIAGNVPNSAVLGPDGNLYIGFKASGDILRVTAPQTEPLPCANVQVMGTTPDTTKDFGLGWIGHDLFGGDGRAAWVIPNGDQCFTPGNGNVACHGTNILVGQTASPTFVMSDQQYPAVNGRYLFVGNPSTITLVDAITLQVTPEYATGFQFLSGMTLDPLNLNLYVADDPSNGLIGGQGRWWNVGNQGGSVAPATLVKFADNVTSPGGGVVLVGTGINPATGKAYRHLWSGDQGGFGLCRLDPDIDSPGPHTMNVNTCLPFVAGVQFKPGQIAFDPILNNLYVVDMQANTHGIFRLHFVPAADGGHGGIDFIHQEVIAGNGGVGHNGLPGCGIAGNVTDSAVLGPDGNLYVGFKRSGDILRVTSPQTEPLPCENVVLIGSTPDRTRSVGLGFIGHDLYGGDGLAAFIIPNADQCMTALNGMNTCQSNNIIGGQTAAPTFVMSDQIYPSLSGRNLFVGQPGSITLVDPVAIRVTQGYVTGFQLLTAMALDPTNLTLYVADDPSAGLLPQQGHWWQVAPLDVTPAVPGAPFAVFATAGPSSATVQWTPFPDGQIITSYVVRTSFNSAGISTPDVIVTAPAGSTAVPTSVTINGLINGAVYEFMVAATDSAGTSRFSVPSNLVTPEIPSVSKSPTHVVASAGNGSATVGFQAVPDYLNGGLPIKVYKIEAQVNDKSTGIFVTVPPTATSALVNGLTNGTAYTFVVVATNQLGDSLPSLPSNVVTPSVPPTNANVSVAILGPASVTAGSNNTFQIRVSNTGTVAFPQVRVTEVYNTSGGKPAAVVASGGTCSTFVGTMLCSLGSLAPGATATVNLTMNVTAQLTNTASVQLLDAAGRKIVPATPATATASLSTAVTTAPPPSPTPTPVPTPTPGPTPAPSPTPAPNPATLPTVTDVQLTGTYSPNNPNGTITWVVTNILDQPANAVQLSSTLPSTLQFVSLTTSAGASCAPLNAGILTCTQSVLAPGQSMIVHVQITPGTIAMQVAGRVSFNGTDTNLVNNRFRMTIPVATAAAGVVGTGGAPAGGGAGLGNTGTAPPPGTTPSPAPTPAPSPAPAPGGVGTGGGTAAGGGAAAGGGNGGSGGTTTGGGGGSATGGATGGGLIGPCQLLSGGVNRHTPDIGPVAGGCPGR